MIAAPNYCLEQSICSYLSSASVASGSVLSGSLFNCYTGIGDVDKAEAPAVIIDCSDMREVVPFSRCYEFNGKAIVKEMAADTATLGILANSIFNEFVSSSVACGNFSNPAYNINIWQLQALGMSPSVSGDALVNTLEFRAIGALVPN